MKRINQIDQKTQFVIIAILALAPYLVLFQNQFVIDDKTFIVGWEIKNSFSNLFQLLAGAVPSEHEGVYRPVRGVIYAILFQLFATNPFGYHLFTLLVHLFATILVYIVGLKVFKKSLIAFFGACLFAVHPIHTETITYIASGVESISIVFFFLSFNFYLQNGNQKFSSKWIISLVFATMAFFTQEITLVLPLLIVLYELTLGQKKINFFQKNWKIYFVFFVPALVYVFIRFFILNIGSRGPYLADSVYMTFLTMCKVFAKYVLLTVFPVNQVNNHTIWGNIEAFVYRGYNPEPILKQTIFDTSVLMSMLIIISIIVLAVKYRKKDPTLSFGIGWFFISLLPVSEIIPQGSVLNERFLYIPSFGAVLVTAYLIGILLNKYPKKQSWYFALMIGVVIVFSGLTYQRNRDWRDELTLWSKDVSVYPETNAYAYFQLGNVYLGRNEFNQAVLNYQKAYEINPHFTVALASIGRVYEVAGERDLAVAQYEKVLATDPTFWEGYRNLANIYQQQGEFNKAREVLERMKTVYPEVAKSLIEGIPELKEATEAGNLKQPDLWLRYHLLQGISLNLPSFWTIKDQDSEVEITDGKGSFSITMTFLKKLSENNEEYVEKQKDDEFGQLVNQGMAKIPQFEWSYVKVFDRQGNQSLVLYLVNKERVIKVVIFPVRQEYNADVDKILGSLKPNDSK